MRGLVGCQFTVVIGNLFLPRLPGITLQAPGDVYRLGPVLLLLVNFEQELERLAPARTVQKAQENFLGAIEQSRTQVVLTELEQCVQALFVAQVGPIEQVLVHADGAFSLAAPPEQAAQGKVQFDRLRIDPDHLDEGLDRLVGLLVEQKIEALEIRARQIARLGKQVLDVDARGQPSQAEEQREGEQPPIFEFHHAPEMGGTGGVSAVGRPCSSLFSARISRRCANSLVRHASTPSAAPSAKKNSMTRT